MGTAHVCWPWDASDTWGRKSWGLSRPLSLHGGSGSLHAVCPARYAQGHQILTGGLGAPRDQSRNIRAPPDRPRGPAASLLPHSVGCERALRPARFQGRGIEPPHPNGRRAGDLWPSFIHHTETLRNLYNLRFIIHSRLWSTLRGAPVQALGGSSERNVVIPTSQMRQQRLAKVYVPLKGPTPAPSTG